MYFYCVTRVAMTPRPSSRDRLARTEPDTVVLSHVSHLGLPVPIDPAPMTPTMNHRANVYMAMGRHRIQANNIPE